LSQAEETAVGLDLDRLGLSLPDNGNELLLDRDQLLTLTALRLR
jgi:hypothetical protein